MATLLAFNKCVEILAKNPLYRITAKGKSEQILEPDMDLLFGKASVVNGQEFERCSESEQNEHIHQDRFMVEYYARATRNSERDYLGELREHHQAIRQIEQEMITTNPSLQETEMENYTDSCKWMRLPILGETPSTVAKMILSDLEQFPNDALAGILVAAGRNQDTTAVPADSIYIDRVGTQFRFCIAGSMTLEELRTLCEQYRATRGSAGER